MPLALLALTISAFAIGTTEFVIVGLMALLTVGNLVAWQAPGYGTLAFVPRNIPHTPPAPLRRQARALMQPRLLPVYAMTAVSYGGSLIAFTFLASILKNIAAPNFGVPRADLFVTTKIWTDNYAKDKLIPSLRDSLAKLRLDDGDMAQIAALDRNGREVSPEGLAPVWD